MENSKIKIFIPCKYHSAYFPLEEVKITQKSWAKLLLACENNLVDPDIFSHCGMCNLFGKQHPPFLDLLDELYLINYKVEIKEWLDERPNSDLKEVYIDMKDAGIAQKQLNSETEEASNDAIEKYIKLY